MMGKSKHAKTKPNSDRKKWESNDLLINILARSRKQKKENTSTLACVLLILHVSWFNIKLFKNIVDHEAREVMMIRKHESL